jgi:phage terminase large subunit-like protein
MDLSRENKEILAMALMEKQRRKSQRRILSFYPEEGKLSRHNYPKHMAFFAAGARYRERAFMAANRVGKTEGSGGYELACHLTGIYPLWWTGRRFDHSVKAWAAGDTNLTVRDILQAKMLGPINEIGTGLLPGEKIVDTKRKAGSIPDAIETVIVNHVSGGKSILNFKSYEAGRQTFQGTEQDVILLDEEPPEDIYTECLTRTMTTNGLIMLTFTPLLGVSKVVLMFLPGGKEGHNEDTGRFCVSATWDDAPHLDETAKEELRKSYPPHQRDARTKGIPMLGSGAIYPISEDDLVINDFDIPGHWPRVFAMDFGWNCTAALWRARDPETEIRYYYAEYKAGHKEPAVHAFAVKQQGAWIRGVCDPAGDQANQKDGEKLLQLYQGMGLDIHKADNSVEAGIYDVWLLMTSGKFKVFKSCQKWLEEFRIYRRDEKGHVVKENDHLMDCSRYEVRSGRLYERQMPIETYHIRQMSKAAKSEDQYYNLATGQLLIRHLPDPNQGYDPMTFGRGQQ